MLNRPVSPAEILLPSEKIDIYKWAVVACDQFITDSSYWENAKSIAEGSPSCLNMILPEIYLDEADTRIDKANRTMEEYLESGVFRNLGNGAVLTERTIAGVRRRGLVICLELESYDTDHTKKPLIRATEKTILSRIPPRVRIRKNAPVEFPHIIVLMNDKGDSIMQDIEKNKSSYEKVYSSELMLGGGYAEGWFIKDSAFLEEIISRINGLPKTDDMLLLVGDGNHSLATAKAVWDSIKDTLPEEERQTHPARFALTELINIYDEGLVFKPIHRCVFGSKHSLLDSFINELAVSDKDSYIKENASNDPKCSLSVKHRGRNYDIFLSDTDSVNAFILIDSILEKLSADYDYIEYIHGDEELHKQSDKDGCTGFMMPVLDKSSFFNTIAKYGVLPKKTFSLGEAEEKRYYIEGRKIIL